MNLSQKYEDNILFIQKFPAEKLIKNMKRAALACVSYISTAEREAIENTEDYSIKYIEKRITKIKILTNKLPWEDYRIELDISSISIYQQKGYSKYELISSIPIEVLRIFTL